ncbi:MAG TPA: ABC transporter ATP-binding protein [Solimonas sp.]|nr:ABC transporter ATP-binding protein [Solimonas sp.]
MPRPLLQLDQLSIAYPGGAGQGEARVLDRLDLALAEGEALGLVGESGSGKTQVALAVMGLLPATARLSGRLRFGGEDLLALPAPSRRALRGRQIAMVFQDPMTSLNPHLRIGLQLAEVAEVHAGLDRAAALAESARWLDAVQVPEALRRLRQYPHELSGGLRQRVAIAMALIGRPRLLLADEPTTALDVSLQAQLVLLLDRLRRELGLALLLISHDLGLVAELCDRSQVLYAGRGLECGPTRALLQAPAHPYTRALLAARPSLGASAGPLAAIPGRLPDARQALAGCVFAERCPEAFAPCHREPPPLRGDPLHSRACHRDVP